MGFFGANTNSFPWTELTSIQQLGELFSSSEKIPVLLFKHSTRCGISRSALNQFEAAWRAQPEACECVYLDLLSHRELSNEIATRTGVYHESPQAILIKNGKAVYSASHDGISAEKVEKLL